MSNHIATTEMSRDDLSLLLGAMSHTRSDLSFVEVLAVRPWMTIRQAHAFLERALATGYLDWSGDHVYRITELGESLKESGLAERFDRAEGEAALARVLERARAWNADPGHPVVIRRIRLFGSMMEPDRRDFGDVDLEFEYAPRNLSDDEFSAHLDALPARRRGGIFFVIDPRGALMAHHARRAQVALARSSRRASVTGAGTIERVGAAWREVYVFDVDTGKERTPSDKTHPRSSPKKELKGPEHEHGGALLPPAIVPSPPPVPAGPLEPFYVGPSRERESILASHTAAWAERDWWGEASKDDEAILKPKMDPKGARDVMSWVLWADEIPTWDVRETDPVLAIREIHARAVAEGLVGARDQVEIFLHNGGVHFEVYLDASRELPGMSLTSVQVDLSVSGGKWDMAMPPNLSETPELGPEETAENRLRPTDNPLHVAMARALARPLLDIYNSTRLQGGAKVELTCAWKPAEFTPAIPSLAPLARDVSKASKQFSLPRSKLVEISERLLKDREESAFSIDREVSMEIRGPFQNLGEPETDEGERIAMTISAQARPYWDRADIALPFGPAESMLEARLQKTLPALRGLGDNWILSVERKSHVVVFPPSCDEDDIVSALASKKVSLT